MTMTAEWRQGVGLYGERMGQYDGRTRLAAAIVTRALEDYLYLCKAKPKRRHMGKRVPVNAELAKEGKREIREFLSSAHPAVLLADIDEEVVLSICDRMDRGEVPPGLTLQD